MTEDRPAHHPDDLAFPQQIARTRSFVCGRPRTPTVAPEGSRIVFLRSPSGTDPANGLWVLDGASGQERLIYDPHDRPPHEETLTPAERARRERARERSTGVVAYATDRDVTTAVFVEGGRLLLADLSEGGGVQELPTSGAPDDPRLDPTGSRVAYVVAGSLHVQEIGGLGRVLASDDEPDVHWGLAEFTAAEEMERARGHWWSPDGTHLVACRVDERPVQVWWIADPTDPAAEPTAVRYPQAGTANAVVTLHLFEAGTGEMIDVVWDEPERFEYLARVSWDEGSPPTVLIQSRDQRTTRLLEVDPATGATTIVREDTDPHWVHLTPGAPAHLDDGRLVTTVDADDSRRLAIDGEPVTPPGLDVASVVHAGADMVITGSEHDEPTETHVWRVAPDGAMTRLSHEPGVHQAAVGGDVVVLTSWGADALEPTMTVHRGDERVAVIGSVAETPVIDPRPSFAVVGERSLRTALLLPGGADPDGWDPQRRLPVLMAPYGGPHHREVERSCSLHLAARFYADRLGVAVLVIDGRGTPGRGTSWERAIAGDFSITLADQVDGLHAAAERWPFLDLDRVAMLGWSFGGELAAGAVIDRPDVVHAAVAGAPVTEQRLYDTHYTERYLGHPDEAPEAYDRSSPIARAERLSRPLLLIHGLADDNVVAAHSLLLSSRLFAAGIHHELLLLPKASHMGGFEELIVGRYLAVVDFLRRSLGLEAPGG